MFKYFSKGFTLIELIVAVAIVLILLAIVGPMVVNGFQFSGCSGPC